MNNEDAVTLRHYIEALMKTYKESHDREHELIADTLRMTEKNLDIRLSHQNRFREQIESERGTFVTKDTYDVHHGEIERRMNIVERELSRMSGRSTAITAAIGVGLLMLQLALHFFAK